VFFKGYRPHRAYTSNVQADTVIDLASLKHIAEIKAGKDPDAIIYDPGMKRVFVSNGESDDITVIDAASEKVSGHDRCRRVVPSI
jgi:DNA-binding beta-propeller fold protein YncE